MLAKYRPLIIITCLLLVQAFVTYRVARNESVPQVASLQTIQEELGDWESVGEEFVDERTLRSVRADDYLIRTYQKLAGGWRGAEATVMVAYFNRVGVEKAPHSPRNCLPGQGWVPNRAEVTSLMIPGEHLAIPVNRYVVAKGEQKAIVFYWYQTATRTVANEYIAKIYLVLDSVRFRRSDTAFVRVNVLFDGNNEDQASHLAADLSRQIYLALKRHIPSV